jgi:SAM-dependent methyltransferase
MDTSELYRSDFRYDKDLSQGDLGPTYGRVLERVGPGRKVLEVGCHTGYFSRVLREHGCQVVGVEINAEAAARAIDDGFDVRVGSVEDPALLADLPREFDVLLLMDVLEHLVDPWTALRGLRERLRPDGRALISLPNVACWTVRNALLRGRWEYTRDGLLDRTHLRFFTFDTARVLIRDSGFTLTEWWATMPSVPLGGKLQASPLTRWLASYWMAAATRRFPNLCVAQFLFEAAAVSPEAV